MKRFSSRMLYIILAISAIVHGGMPAQSPPGDANADTYLSTSDVTAIKDTLLGKSVPAGDADANQDAGVDVADVVYLTEQLKGIIPDGTDVASPLEPAVRRKLGDIVDFLINGNPPTQMGVEPGAFDPLRIAILRGRVLNGDGRGLPGVRVEVLNSPQYGFTMTRPDGSYDLVVPGGTLIRVCYNFPDRFPSQRDIETPINDYRCLPDVMLLAADSKFTDIDFAGGSGPQIHQGSEITDQDGTRCPVLIFNQGTTASLRMPDGSTTTVAQLCIRASEYTVGENGPMCMPADLPPTSGYTFAIEFSADEAMEMGATTIEFSEAVAFHLENFLNLPVGIQVPSAYFDRQKGIWVPTTDGLVIKVVAENGGLAELDVVGDDQPSTAGQYLALGVTDAERQQLAALYEPGQTLWRVPVMHFTPYDFNYGDSAPTGAQEPRNPIPDNGGDGRTDGPQETDGQGTIDQELRVFRESIPLAGTDFTLNYSSERTAGDSNAYEVTIPLTGDSIDNRMKRIELEIEIAGGITNLEFPPSTHLSHTYVWDGRDAYGRDVQGEWPAVVKISYVYDGFYNIPPSMNASFGFPSGQLIPGDAPSRQEKFLSQQYTVMLGAWDYSEIEFGGWSLNINHRLDPASGLLLLGDGTIRVSRQLGGERVHRIAGGGTVAGLNADGGFAMDAIIGRTNDIDIGPDGALYIADSGNHAIRRVGRDGILTTVAGTGVTGFTPDGLPAMGGRMNAPRAMAIDGNGRIYFYEPNNRLIRYIDEEGLLRTIGGTRDANATRLGDGLPAIQVRLDATEMAIAPDGTLYLLQNGGTNSEFDRIRRIDTSGIVTTIAGGVELTPPEIGDGGPAVLSDIESLTAIAMGPDGSIYVAEDNYGIIRRIDPSGIITTVAGGGNPPAFENGDGLIATAAEFISTNDLIVTPDGELIIADDFSDDLRIVTTDGIIKTIMGESPGASGSPETGWPALEADLTPDYIDMDADGRIYIAHNNFGGTDTDCDFYVMTPAIPGYDEGDILIPNLAGTQVYRFDQSGLHLQTLEFMSGQVIYEFGYNDTLDLISVTDKFGNTTRIDRDSEGLARSITGPFGRVTNLEFDANGMLNRVTNPRGDSVRMTYQDNGLLTEIVGPLNEVYTVDYDQAGHVTRTSDPEGRDITFDSVNIEAGRGTLRTTGLDRQTTVTISLVSDGNRIRTVDYTSGLEMEETQRGGSTERAYNTGMSNRKILGPDPRFQMLAPLTSRVITSTPSGLRHDARHARTVDLENRNDLFSLIRQVDLIFENDRISSRTYVASTRIATDTSAAGRTGTTLYNGNLQPAVQSWPEMHDRRLSYDERGRLKTESQGVGDEERTFTISYNSDGDVDSVIDPVGGMESFEYDANGRLLRHVQPEGRTIEFKLDANGNITEMDPPGPTLKHEYTFNRVNMMDHFAQGPTMSFSRVYNADRDLTALISPAGTRNYIYDSRGRIETLADDISGSTTVIYNPDTSLEDMIFNSDGVELTFEYDGMLRTRTVWSGPVQGSVERKFDDDFRIIETRVNNSNPIAHERDADLLMTVAGGLEIGNDPHHDRVTTTSAGNVRTTQTYNLFGEMETYTASFNGTEIASFTYSHDKLGRITSVVERLEGGPERTLNYEYDGIGRLVAVTGSATRSYTYDLNSNRLAGPDSETGTYSNLDRIIQYAGRNYTYDDAGRLQMVADGGSTTQYLYDLSDNLRTVTLPGGTEIDYRVDGKFRRVAKLVDNVKVKGWLWLDPERIIAELDGSNQVISRFVYGTQRFSPDLIINGGNTYRVIPDHLGSIRLVVNVTDGTVIQRMDYDEFGRVTLDTNPGFQPLGYAGGLYDADTGLVRFGRRDYDPAAGRWTTPDPSLMLSRDPNLYAYVFNDPINNTDPLGFGPSDNNLPPGTTREVLHTISTDGELRRVDIGDHSIIVQGEVQFVRDTSPGGRETYNMVPVGDDSFGALIDNSTNRGRIVQPNNSVDRLSMSGQVATDSVDSDLQFVINPDSELSMSLPGSDRNVSIGTDSYGGITVQTGIPQQ